MILENVEEITENNQSSGYEIGDYKLTFKNTYDSKEYGKEKKFTINANDEKSPDSFYYVHIDVDLNQIANCTCQDSRCKCRQEFAESESHTSDEVKLSSIESDQIESTDEEPEHKRRR